MLVITRNKGQSFLIGDDIEVYVVEAQDGRVKIGIRAPKTMRVLRRELVDEITSTNAEAAGGQFSLRSLAQAFHPGEPE